MLTELLGTFDLSRALRGDRRELYPSAEDRAAWDGIPEEFRREIRELARSYAALPWPVRTASGFLAFSRDGSRQADEKPYFTRRRKLCAAALSCCAFPETALDDVVDGVWLLCEESSWVISAHNVNPIPGAPSPAEYPLPDVRKPYVDLFSAQTGMILSLVSHLLSARLDAVSPLLRTRIREEIRSRILRPFMETDDFWWMGFRRTDLNNWTPWILSNILVCACLDPMPAPELAALITRACGMLDRYLGVLPEDGGCDEGAGYWNMAGGALLDCLTLLERVSGGKIACWDLPKLRNILVFPLRAEMGNGWFANFADCDARPFLSGERLETAGVLTGNPALVRLGTRMRGTIADQLNDVPHLTRALDLIFHPPASVPEAEPDAPRDRTLPDLQLRMLEKGPFLLACKGGHNGENHNHNDVGSFILFVNGEPAVVDAGNMVYTAKTFSADRYSLWNVRAAFHNLPLIGDEEQRPGREYAAERVEFLPDGLALNLEKAYGEAAGLLSLRRCFSLSADGLILTDRGHMNRPRPVTWVFMLRHAPAAVPGGIEAGPLRLGFPPALKCAWEELPIDDARMRRSWPGSLFRLTLTGEMPEQFCAEFRLTESADRRKAP